LLLWWQRMGVPMFEFLISVQVSEQFPCTHEMNIAEIKRLGLLYDARIPTRQNLYPLLIANNHAVMQAELHFRL